MSTSPLTKSPSAAADPRSEAMCRTLAQNWWAIGLRGAFAVLFGILTFVMPVVTMATLVILFAAYMLVDGVFGIVSGVKAARKGERWGWLVGEGLANIVAGLVAFLWPGITVLVFVYLVAFWSIVTGGLMTAAAFKLKLDHGRWWLVLAGIFSAVFGILLALAPIAGAVALTLWLGAYAIVFGVMLLVLAFRLRGRRDTPATPSAPSAPSAAAPA